MPELPEVEVLCQHLAPLVRDRTIAGVRVVRERVIRPTGKTTLSRALRGAMITDLTRRGKFLLFHLRKGDHAAVLLGHLGMTGRMFVQPPGQPLPTHTAVTLDLDGGRFVYQDTRGFGRFTLELASLDTLGPEPLSDDFDPAAFHRSLRASRQAVKVKLLDQSLVAGVGNIYASEALHRAGISPRKAARRLTRLESDRLHTAIRTVLDEAIRQGSTIPLDFAGSGSGDGLFYYGRRADRGGMESHGERLLVYDRDGEPCAACGTPIRKIVQAARSTFYCPACQRA